MRLAANDEAVLVDNVSALLSTIDELARILEQLATHRIFDAKGFLHISPELFSSYAEMFRTIVFFLGGRGATLDDL